MKLAALLAGTALALVPTGTAFAGETGKGLAHGNCGNSSKGGVHTPLLPGFGNGNGNGGLRHVTGCVTVVTPPAAPPVDKPVDEPVGGPAETPVEKDEKDEKIDDVIFG